MNIGSNAGIGIIAGLLLAIAIVVGGFVGLLLAVLLGAAGFLIGSHVDGTIDLSALTRSRRG